MKIEAIIYTPKKRFQAVDLGDAKILLGIQIIRDDDAGSVTLMQEVYGKSILKSTQHG